jgi:hypothetical protein
MTAAEQTALIKEINRKAEIRAGRPFPVTALEAKLNRGSALISLNAARALAQAQSEPKE